MQPHFLVTKLLKTGLPGGRGLLGDPQPNPLLLNPPNPSACCGLVPGQPQGGAGPYVAAASSRGPLTPRFPPCCTPCPDKRMPWTGARPPLHPGSLAKESALSLSSLLHKTPSPVLMTS